MIMNTCTFVVESPISLEKLKTYAESLGAKLVSEDDIVDGYVPRTKEEILKDFTDVVKDIKSGKALEEAMSSEDFFGKYKNHV